ncbi:BrxE family protein [Mesorhizobium sp. M7A.F.Ca.US.001.01.1.1]|nr:BrxE family protein [Mesorhizobium sp. M7A.F.Ca.US.001.01.1.1]
MTKGGIDFDRLLKLRLVVARVGEMDLAKWWNTRGQLGRLGAAAIRRGFPRTHYFAQARSVFAVAAFRCREVFDPPQSVTLWHLTETLEEEFEAHWERCLDQADAWKPFFLELEALKETEVKTALQSFNLITDDDLELFSRLRRSAEGRAVPLPTPFTSTDQDILSLALGFARGEPGALAVPYAHLEIE